MIKNIKSVLISWNASSSERQKLQHTYLVLVVVIVFGSGIVSLINGNAGHELVKVAVFGVAVFLANAVVWNLLQSALLTKLTKKPRRK